MVSQDIRGLGVADELMTPARKNIRLALNYIRNGKTVSMCSGINQTPAAKQCMDNQEYVKEELIPALKNLKRHDDRITRVERDTQDILESISRSADVTEKLNGSIIRLVTSFEHYIKDFDKMETRILKVEDGIISADKIMVSVRTKQNVYIGIAGTLSVVVLGILAKVFIIK